MGRKENWKAREIGLIWAQKTTRSTSAQWCAHRAFCESISTKGVEMCANTYKLANVYVVFCVKSGDLFDLYQFFYYLCKRKETKLIFKNDKIITT